MMTGPVEILLNEHRLIEEVLDGLERTAEAYRKDSVPPAREAAEIVWFLRAFADGCHHAKEEHILFPLLESKGLSPNLGPTAAMRQDHRLGAFLIADMERGLAESGEPARRRFVHAAEAYAVLLRAHIRKEDHCVFALAAACLGPEEARDLAASFRKADAAFAAGAEGADLSRCMGLLDSMARLEGRASRAGLLLHPPASASLAYSSTGG